MKKKKRGHYVQLLNTFSPVFQIEEGSVYYSAGGLMVEHPLISPLVAAMVFGTLQ